MSVTFYNCDGCMKEVPHEFLKSCLYITNMMADMNNDDEQDIIIEEDMEISIPDHYSISQVEQLIKFFQEISAFTVKTDDGDDISYIDYFDKHNDEFIRNYTNKSVDPPYSQELVDIYQKFGDEMIQRFIIMDEFFQYERVIICIAMCIVAFRFIGPEDKVDEMMSQIARITEEIYKYEGEKEEKRTKLAEEKNIISKAENDVANATIDAAAARSRAKALAEVSKDEAAIMEAESKATEKEALVAAATETLNAVLSKSNNTPMEIEGVAAAAPAED